MQIVLIGSGNVASHLGKALYKAGHEIVQVYSKTQLNANTLAQQLNAQAIINFDALNKAADWYILSVKDDALAEVVDQLPQVKGIVSHTAGSVPMTILKKFSHHNVFYPFQTFSKASAIHFQSIPILIESNSDQTSECLKKIADEISDTVLMANSQQRGQLHIAAVFACNFVNHMYAIADDLLKENDLPFDLLLPLIKETANKMEHMSPQLSQTGPASRNDQEIIKKHLQSLENHSHLKNLYQLLSNSILNKLGFMSSEDHNQN